MNIDITDSGKADIFVAIFQHISKFTEHMNIMFEKERLYIQAINSSQIVILEIFLPKEWFNHYFSDGINIGVNSNLFYKVLKKREKLQTIHMECSSLKDMMSFHFSGKDKTIFDKQFEMPLIDIDMELLGIPHIVHQAEFSLSTEKFSNLVSQLKEFGDNLEIECSEAKIVLCSHSSENGKMMTEIDIDDLDEFSIDEGENLRIDFALKYLHDICQYQRLTKRIEIKISQNFPMMIMYRLGDSLDVELPDERTDEIISSYLWNAPRMVFYLAPKIIEDD
jgi:proliferating cell nuclear antigen PCNA